jgi:tetratricopeptide (TPR) repeat protein
LSGQQMADRYTYLPLLGICLAVVWLAASLVPRLTARPFVWPAIASVVVVAYGAAACVQASYWHDSVSLFRHAVDVGEKNPYSLTTLGWALVNDKRFDEAKPPLRQAVELTPDFGQAQFLLGCVLQRESKFDEAAEHFRAALATDDTNAAAHLNLGTILLAQRKFADARRELERAAHLDQGNGRAQAAIAETCLRLRQYGDAIEHAKRALELDPSLTGCRRIIVVALRDQGRLDEAIEQLRQIVTKFPADVASQKELERLRTFRASQRSPATR